MLLANAQRLLERSRAPGLRVSAELIHCVAQFELAVRAGGKVAFVLERYERARVEVENAEVALECPTLQFMTEAVRTDEKGIPLCQP